MLIPIKDYSFFHVLKQWDASSSNLVIQVLYFVFFLIERGYNYLPLKDIKTLSIKEKFSFPPIISVDNLKRNLILSPLVGGYQDKKTPFILVGDLLYIRRIWNYEQYIVSFFSRSKKINSSNDCYDIVELPNKAMNYLNGLTDKQKEVMSVLLRQNLTLIMADFCHKIDEDIVIEIIRFYAILFMEIERSLHITIVSPVSSIIRKRYKQIDVLRKAYEEARNKIYITYPDTIDHLLRHKTQPIFHPGFDSVQKIVTDLLIVENADMLKYEDAFSLVEVIDKRTKCVFIGEPYSLYGLHFWNRFRLLKNRKNEKDDCISPSQEINTNKKNVNNPIVLDISRSENIRQEFFRSLLLTLENDKFSFHSPILDFPTINIVWKDIQNYLSKIIRDKAELWFWLHQRSSSMSVKERIYSLVKTMILTLGDRGDNHFSMFNNCIVSQCNHLVGANGIFFPNGTPILVAKDYPHLDLLQGDIGLYDLDNSKKERLHFMFDAKQTVTHSLKLIQKYQICYAINTNQSRYQRFKETVLVFPDRFCHTLNREMIYRVLVMTEEKCTFVGTKDVIKQVVSTLAPIPL